MEMKSSLMSFFANSEFIDRMALKQLSHIQPNWELTWDPYSNEYKEEYASFAKDFNDLIRQIDSIVPNENYHQFEDIIVESTKKTLNLDLRKEGKIWIGVDYVFILEQGGFSENSFSYLLQAASGRIHVAKKFGQLHFDMMEKLHQEMLANLLAVCLYHSYKSTESHIK